MRVLLPLAFLMVSTSTHANNMHVVVYTSDRVIVEYLCENRVADRDALASRRMLKNPGRVTWHAVGGVKPYTLIEQRRDEFGNICITVMDATGTMATGCSIMLERKISVLVECQPLEEDTTDYKLSKKLREHIAYRDSLNEAAMRNGYRDRTPVRDPNVTDVRGRHTRGDREPGPRPAPPVRNIDQTRGTRGVTGTPTPPPPVRRENSYRPQNR